MRQNIVVFELFHNFDIPLNYPYFIRENRRFSSIFDNIRKLQTRLYFVAWCTEDAS